jgi:hypothetical protein
MSATTSCSTCRAPSSAGLRAVWMNRTGQSKHLEHEVVPDAIVGNFDELLDWLKRAQMRATANSCEHDCIMISR